jgi:hypothetical protein
MSDQSIAPRSNSMPTLEPGTETPSLMNFVALAVRDPSVNVEKLEALLRIQRDISADEARAQFNRAMMEMQPELPRIKKSKEVEYKGKVAFKYATWESVDAGIRPILNRFGFCLSFNTTQRQGEGGGPVVTGELLHVGGHSKSASMALPLDSSGGKSNLQGYASSTSFGQRYVTKMLLNLVFEGDDDDGVQGGMTYITVEQQQQLTKLLASTRSELGGFLDYMEVDAIESIQAKNFSGALNALQAKARKMGQGAPA